MSKTPASPTFKERAKTALQEVGMRWTQQRAALMELIESAPAHQDAEGYYGLAQARGVDMSLSTVYRTLNVLKRHGLVDERHLSEEHHHYEPRTGEQHYHFVCTSCGSVPEFSGGAVERLREQLRREHGFEAETIDLDLSGLCARCAPRRDPA
ncbi:MAG: Fur family transcriptional regulator [Chloroflexota bacterium]